MSIDHIFQRYQKAQIDYQDQFLKIYIAYNAWYYCATGTMNDRDAIGMLKKRYVIWEDYCNGKVMRPLRVYLEQLADLTQRGSTFSTGQSKRRAILRNSNDWQALIEYWYQVRCIVVHGGKVSAVQARLAYETLLIFMSEIVQRIHKIYNASQKELIMVPDLWQVDMSRCE